MEKNNFIKIIFKILLILIFIFCVFYDAGLSNINFPFLSSIFFGLFMIFNLTKNIFR